MIHKKSIVLAPIKINTLKTSLMAQTHDLNFASHHRTTVPHTDSQRPDFHLHTRKRNQTLESNYRPLHSLPFSKTGFKFIIVDYAFTETFSTDCYFLHQRD